MTQEAFERKPFTPEESKTVTFDWDELVKAIKNRPNLLTPQKEILINLLSQLAGNEVQIMEAKLDAHRQFADKIEWIWVNGITCEVWDKGEELVDEVLRRVFGIDYDLLAPLERREVEDILDGFSSDHRVNDEPIQSALDELQTELDETESQAGT